MNIEQAKAIPLSIILEKMGVNPHTTTPKRIRYLSPYRPEKTPSFFVYAGDNRWYDYGDARGGDVIDLVQCYLESQQVGATVSDALRWLKNMIAYQPITPVSVPDAYPACAGKDQTLVFKNAEPLKHTGLIRYGESRGIPPSILKQYLEQVSFLNRNSGKTLIALGMRNESKGYDVRNPNFKGCIRTKDISFIRGTIPKPPGIHVFEGFMDFLSVITQRNGKPFDDDALILHSLNCMQKGTAYLRHYGYEQCFTWFDNDEPGRKAIAVWDEFCSNEPGLKHIPQNLHYAPYKDVNAAHMAKLELKGW
ncbi:MAG: toprim domain-containing protein [Bacteroidetes bacterium]|nr:toprim domain-containing protein [Bacteroidota bacterium]